MGILEGIIEAYRAGIVARPFDIATEIALPSRREKPARDRMGDVGEKATIFPPGVEHFAMGTVVILRIPDVRLNQHAATLDSLRDLHRAASFRHSCAKRRRDARAERAARLGAAGANRNDAAECVGAVSYRSGTPRYINAFDGCGIEKRRAGSSTPLSRDAAA